MVRPGLYEYDRYDQMVRRATDAGNGTDDVTREICTTSQSVMEVMDPNLG